MYPLSTDPNVLKHSVEQGNYTSSGNKEIILFYLFEIKGYLVQ